MRVLKALSLRRKIILVSMLVSGTALLLACLSFITYDVWRTQVELKQHLRKQVELVAANSAVSLANDDLQSVRELVGTLATNPQIVLARVTTLADVAVAEYRADAAILDDITMRSLDSLSTSTYLQFNVPIQFNSEVIGQLRLVADKSVVYQRVERYLWLTLCTLVATLLFVLIVSSRLQKLLFAPIVRLGDIARRVSDERDYSVRAAIDGGDELAGLTRDFNSMLDHIQHRDQELEEQVTERTRELVKLNDQLKHQVYHDALTKLPNRALFDDRLTLSLAQAERTKTKVAVMFLDLDRFKAVNDTLGHEVGDELLRVVGHRLQSSVRKQDTVARLGGDEFTVILPNLESSQFVGQVAQTIITAIKEPIEIQGHRLQISASIGVSLFPDDGLYVTVLKRNADAAMYAAKESGLATYQFFSSELNERMHQRLLLQTELEQVINNNGLQIHYQPQVSKRGTRIVGIEALVRWPHAERGLVAPNEFIPFAEETGLITDLDMWVLREACTFLAQSCKKYPDLHLCVNLSVQNLREQNLATTISEILNQTGIDAGRIEFEITESLLIRHDDETVALLNALKELGMRIAIDNFGTGYSVLRHLRQYPFDTITIDREFVHNLGSEPHDVAIVRAVLAIAQSLDLAVIGKGVETVEQALALEALGCDLMQGFLFAAPQPAEETLRLLDTGLPGADVSEALGKSA